MAKYKCKHCGKTVVRRSVKQWIKSWCQELNRFVHIYKQ